MISSQFELLLQEAKIKPRLLRELRFDPTEAWNGRELLAVQTRNRDDGVLIISLENIFVTPYTISRRLVDKQTGRSKPVVCDFCFTWQAGGNAARITFARQTDMHAVTLLCCADLDCSSHVRDKTRASIISRAQLHEDLSERQRADRLKLKLQDLTELLALRPIL